MADEDTSWVNEYDGLELDTALARANEEGRLVRVLHPGQPMTLDWRPTRLNIYVDESGAATRFTAG